MIGTPNLGTYLTDQGLSSVLFISYGFSFNGDDALGVSYGGTLTDIFGNPGFDPRSEWNGNGVSTLNQNIQLLQSISDGDLDGWTDPSSRFELVSSVPSTTGGLSGFGSAPAIYDEPTNHITSFNANTLSSSVIELTWTDAIGSQLPSGYLIKASIFDDIVYPDDYTTENEDTDLSDGKGAVVIAYGLQLYNWSGLNPGTEYYFKVFHLQTQVVI